MTSIFVVLDEPTAAHLRRALSEHFGWCRANAVPVPPMLTALVERLASGGQERPTGDELSVDSDSPRMALDYREAGARLGVSDRTVRRLVATKALPAVTIGGCRRIRVADLADYMERVA